MKGSLARVLVLYVIACGVQAAESRPNIVFILADDHSANALGCYPSRLASHAITPNIDALAAEGMIFDHNYAGAPHCSPSRVALVLGKASYRVGVYDIMGRGDMKLPEEETTIAEVLKDEGYIDDFSVIEDAGRSTAQNRRQGLDGKERMNRARARRGGAHPAPARRGPGLRPGPGALARVEGTRRGYAAGRARARSAPRR